MYNSNNTDHEIEEERVQNIYDTGEVVVDSTTKKWFCGLVIFMLLLGVLIHAIQ